MSTFHCPHCHEEIDIFSKGGAERTAAQFGVEFLGSLELDPSIRKGGDRGMPVSLAGPESDVGGGFFRVAEKVALAAERVAAQGGGVLEIE